MNEQMPEGLMYEGLIMENTMLRERLAGALEEQQTLRNSLDGVLLKHARLRASMLAMREADGKAAGTWCSDE